MSKKITIIGAGTSGVIAYHLVRLKALDPDIQIVTTDEAKELEPTIQTLELSREFLLPDVEYTPPSTRAERRRDQRRNKKRRK